MEKEKFSNKETSYKWILKYIKMSHENLTFQQLRSKCKEMKLKSCAGKGVDRKFLINLIGTATLTEEELKIKEHDPDFYEVIKYHVPNMPDAERYS